jgi:hypothetical protein
MVFTSLLHDGQVFNAGTDGGRTISAGPPGPEQPAKLPTHLRQVRERLFDVLELQVNEIQDVLAGRSARPLERDDARDLVQPEAETSRLRDEPEEGQRLRSVHAVARSGAASGREDAGLLVEPERLPADAALRRYLSDQQAVARHGSSLNPAPKGKVKRIFSAP